MKKCLMGMGEKKRNAEILFLLLKKSNSVNPSTIADKIKRINNFFQYENEAYAATVVRTSLRQFRSLAL